MKLPKRHLISEKNQFAFPRGLENPCERHMHMCMSSDLKGVVAVRCEGVEGITGVIGQLMLQSSCKWIVALVLNQWS